MQGRRCQRQLQPGWGAAGAVSAHFIMHREDNRAARRRVEAMRRQLCPATAVHPSMAAAGTDARASAGALVDQRFFEENGYVVVKRVVPQANIEAVKADMETFLGIDLASPEDWYRGGGKYGETKYEIGAGMVEMYQSQAMWNNRQHPTLHQAFAEIFGTDVLTVSIDRVNLKPPELEGDCMGWGRGLGLHWDGARPKDAVNGDSKMLRVQGVLCLSNTLDESSGGFICVPGFPKKFDEWAATVCQRTTCLWPHAIASVSKIR
eukprot:SAG31_NODE_6742_length_1903_cov_1.584257_2_plen_263_part_00